MNPANKLPKEKQLALASAFLVANAFIWYFIAARTLENLINNVATNYFEILVLWTLHFSALFISIIGGTLLLKKLTRKSLFVLWTSLGILSPLALLAIPIAQIQMTGIISILFGLSLGLGMPNCMEYFTNLTSPGNRGRYAGLTILVSGLGFFVLGLIDNGNLALNALTLILWRLTGFLFLYLPTLSERKGNLVVNSYRKILRKREFILYLIPWIMFSLVNYLSTPIQYDILGENQVKFLIIIENALMGLFAIVGGFLSDRIGRKRTAIGGFVMLGIGFSVLGLYPNATGSWYFYTIVDGIAWGILYVIFVISIWGEIDYHNPSDKYYAVGVLPFFISKFLQLIFGNYISTDISKYALFSFIAFFLFIAVLPLVYAPETLPEKLIKDRDLKSYVENAKKKAQKESGQPNNKEKHLNKQANEASEATESNEYDAAKKLAEKYY
jgi:MFS family permease